MSDTQAWMITDDVANQVLQRGFVADEYQLEIAVPGERSGCRTYDNLGAEVAAHRIERNN
jgi:hypothetical protein